MTTIKHILQKEVFLPNDERLVGLVNVTQAGKKKKSSKHSFLCAALSTSVEGTTQVNVYQVKKSDKGETYKKKINWPLKDLKVVDGKDAKKHAQRHLTHKPKFENVPEHLLEEIIRPVSQGQAPVEGASSVPELEEYQALSNQEEEDLETLMSKCSAAISNAENFAEQLSKQLSILDGANMHVIMGSEDQVFNLMRLLDDGIQQAEIIESKLDSYDQILQGVKEQMELMKDKDMLLSVRNANHQKLLEELENVVHQLDLDGKYIASLNKGDLSTPNGILDCTAAAQQLQRCRQATIHPALMKMSAVEEQMKKFNQLVQEFSKRLAHHLNNLFIHQGNEIGETLSRHSTELRLPPHHSSHRDLTPYTELMAWLKQSDRSSFRQLTKVYTGSLSKLYTKEIQDFLENSRMAAMGKGDKSRLNVSGMRLSGSSASLGAPLDNKRAGSIHSIDSAVQGMDADIAMRHLFDQSEEVDESEDTGDIWMKQKPRITVQEYIVENLGEGLQSRIPTSQLRQINEELRGMMNELFPMLEEDLEAFITFGDKMDGFYSMYMLVRMSEHVTNTQDTGSFLSVTFASSLVKIKRNFDKFVQLQIRAIEENKVSKKAKCGIISFDFANQAENIFRGSERHTDLDKAYQRLVRAIFDTINRIAAEHPKTPREKTSITCFVSTLCKKLIVKMLSGSVCVSCNHLHFLCAAILSQLKITCLEADRKEARAKYVENLNAYTKERLGRPLEKLHTFVEGVKSKMAQGVKAEEVGFQLAFSKTELRKVIKDYTGKEVKKSLDHMYKKLEKHLSEEENLYQVVWLSMQNEFMKQYNTYTDLINLCYPDSNINLEFTVDNVLEFFSNIAQSH
ncbi:EXOC1-like protein [Mya arenaria]|uniref:EXOC1-like protein n=1 Tax=Mya arenaria TaxID=6604 RepID=A0ABY7DTD1_MYAAR|nr:EXOC1-like protein [Mya arenaria]